MAGDKLSLQQDRTHSSGWRRVRRCGGNRNRCAPLIARAAAAAACLEEVATVNSKGSVVLVVDRQRPQNLADQSVFSIARISGELVASVATAEDRDAVKLSEQAKRSKPAVTDATELLRLRHTGAQFVGQVATAWLAPPPLPPLRRHGSCDTAPPPPPPPPLPPREPSPPWCRPPTSGVVAVASVAKRESSSSGSASTSSVCSCESLGSSRDEFERASSTSGEASHPQKRVSFAPEASLRIVYEITPYAEIYGMHPRLFDFGKRFWMLPATGFPVIGGGATTFGAAPRLSDSQDVSESDSENESDSESEHETNDWSEIHCWSGDDEFVDANDPDATAEANSAGINAGQTCHDEHAADGC
mmetsp:Transcript_65628/g.182551  ORF Transcript_65628/g.182551 Transcript_65628/m.182551 type:complete len:359 (-) Transcript_65628:253-1329(-)